MKMDKDGVHCNANWGQHITGSYGNIFGISGTCEVTVSPSDGFIRVSGIARNQIADAVDFNTSYEVTSFVPTCTYTISPTSQTFTSTGGTGTVTVTASASSCAWTASYFNWFPWITITSGASGIGNGTVTER